MGDIIKKLIKTKQFIILASTVTIFISGLGLGIGIKRTVEKKVVSEPNIVATADEEATGEVNAAVKNKKPSEKVVKEFLINYYSFLKARKEFFYTGDTKRYDVVSGISRILEETRWTEVPEMEPLKIFYSEYKENLKTYVDTIEKAGLEAGLFKDYDIRIYADEADGIAQKSLNRLYTEVLLLEYEYDLDVMESDEVNNEATRLIAIARGEKPKADKETPEDRKKAAMSELKYCIETWNFSYPVTVRNMEKEGFTIEEIDSAIKEYDVDWNEVAVEDAELWHGMEPDWTYEELYHQLYINEFTEEQAEYGARTVLGN